MHIFDIENKSYLNDVLLESLKLLGVRCRLPKKLKVVEMEKTENDKENIYSENQIFQKPLRLLKKCVASRINGSTLLVPEFIVDACSVIEKDIKVEGIFRKAGSTCKQKERKMELNQGKKLSCEYHVLDACSLVKLFFRELPQPLIPYSYHDMFLKGLLLSTYEKELEALMLACLLLPEENLATLAYFMEFLLKVSWHSEKNKMNLKNLAIILTPTLMPLNKEMRASNNLEMAHHFKVIEMLIENAEKIGVVPDHIIMSMLSVSDKKMKKKRRSGSITRMFTGLKKIVSSRSSAMSELDDSTLSTPDNLISLGKRKNCDSSSTLNLSVKKKCLENSSTATLTPIRSRMQGYATSVHSTISLAPKRSCASDLGLTGSDERIPNERGRFVTRTSRLNLVELYTSRKRKSKAKLEGAISTESLLSIEEEITLENKSSVIHRGRRNSPLKVLEIIENGEGREEETREKIVDLSDNEMITVPKVEYEAIKNRVSALEEDLEMLTSMHPVQYEYEKTLEKSEKLNDDASDKLAKRLKKELNIRLSLENKVVRSPSARKIGSFKRRSKEMANRSSEPKTNLKRGRPNTLLTGLPSPRYRTMSNENMSATPKAVPITRSATFRTPKDEWISGETFFAREHLLRKLSPTVHGRPSLAEIRSHNAGMVLEKAKLFNSMNEAKESAGKAVTRRQSIRLENLRRLNEAEGNQRKMLTRTRSLGSDKKSRHCSLLVSEGGGPSSKSVTAVLEVHTPKSQRPTNTPVTGSRRETPSIKKSLVTRSPRKFAKTPVSQMRSTIRTRATPMKALPESGATPRTGLRRSPRLLCRTLSHASSRLKD